MFKPHSSVHSLAATVLMTVFALSACERPEPHGHRDDWKTDRDERHESRHESQTRAVENFDAVELRGAGEMVINVGPASSLTIDASERALKRIDTHVSGSTLVIEVAKSHGWFADYGHLKFTITAPALKSLESNGAGEITIHGLNGGDQRLQLAGAHDVKADGKLDSLTIELSGAGSVDYSKVEAADAKVTVNGAGNVEVQAKSSLHAEVNGVGAVRYSGEPQKVESELHGLGSISRR